MNNPEKSTEYHERDLIATLRTLRDNLPRTMINLVTPPSKKIFFSSQYKNIFSIFYILQI